MGRKTTHDVLLVQHINQTAVILFGNQITTICIHAFLQKVRYLAEVGTHSGEHGLLIGIGRTALLLLTSRCSRIRLASDGAVDGLCQLRFTLLNTLCAVDGFGQRIKLRLHVLIGGVILCGQLALLVLMGVQELAHLTQQVSTVFQHFRNSHFEYLH